MGNGEAKELTCTTHVHELSGGSRKDGGIQGRGESSINGRYKIDRGG